MHTYQRICEGEQPANPVGIVISGAHDEEALHNYCTVASRYIGLL